MRNRSGCGAVIVGMALQSLALACSVLPARAQAPSPASELQRPALQIGSAGRFNEKKLVGPERGGPGREPDHFSRDRVKFIPLASNDGSVWLSLGGQAPRAGGVLPARTCSAPRSPRSTDAYLLSRFRLSADLHVTPYFRMFVEGKSSMALDRDLQGGRTTAYVDEVTHPERLRGAS